MKVLLVANYRPDEQQSMLRFAALLASGLKQAGVQVRVVAPEPRLLPLFKATPAPVRKWVAYLDKFVLFTGTLWTQRPWADIVHICDHSNAIYAHFLPGASVTCHDLLAVRGALGEDTDCPATLTGKLLQRLILSGLRRSRLVICDSTHTQGDLQRLAGRQLDAPVVLLGLNRPYRPFPPDEIQARLAALPDLWTRPYLLHVGSALARKNREGVLRIFALAHRHWDGQVVLAGEPAGPALRELAQQLGIAHRLIEVPSPDDERLEALYSGAHALLFPSRFEGFGWPPLEAQQCHCPVICSDTTSLPEVVANSALVFSLDDEQGMASAILRLTDPHERSIWIARGRQNIERFRPERMIDEYLGHYRRLLATPGPDRA